MKPDSGKSLHGNDLLKYSCKCCMESTEQTLGRGIDDKKHDQFYNITCLKYMSYLEQKPT